MNTEVIAGIGILIALPFLFMLIKWVSNIVFYCKDEIFVKSEDDEKLLSNTKTFKQQDWKVNKFNAKHIQEKREKMKGGKDDNK